jgi:hypothetical protein
MDHYRGRIGRIDGHNRRRPAAANVRIATPMRCEFEIVPKCPAHFRRRERRSVVEVNFRTQFEREGPGVIRGSPLACRHSADRAVQRAY